MWWLRQLLKCSAMLTTDSLDRWWAFFKVYFKKLRILSRGGRAWSLRYFRCDLPACWIFLNKSDCRWRDPHSDRRYKFYDLAYTEWNSKINTHHIVGWYHSHPSFGCWLSGIDVNTQEIFQIGADPFIAIVVDPIKSVNLRNFELI